MITLEIEGGRLRRILRHLVLSRAVSEETVAEYTSRVGERRVQRELLRAGVITEEQVARAVSAVSKLPYVDLPNTEVDPLAIAKVNADLCRRHMVLPLALRGSQLTLAMVDPDDVLALDDVTGSTGLQVMPVIVTREAMGQALDRYMRLDSQIAEISDELREATASTVSSTESLDDDGDDAPIVRFVNLPTATLGALAYQRNIDG